LGKKAYQAGYDLPYSAGLGINYIWQKSDLVIENLNRFNHGPRTISVKLCGLTTPPRRPGSTRPDIGVSISERVWDLAKSKPSTAVDFAFLFRMRQEPESRGHLQHERIFSNDDWLRPHPDNRGAWSDRARYNFTWNDIPQLSKPAFAFVFSAI
jgi:hypothetical protein